jgi:hypothetical protein
MMIKALQKIVFPKNDKLAYHNELFYKGMNCGLVGEEQALFLASGIHLDFATYLNGFSLKKDKIPLFHRNYDKEKLL